MFPSNQFVDRVIAGNKEMAAARVKVGQGGSAAIRGLGRSPKQLRHLFSLTATPDQIGSAAAIVRQTGARTYMHPLDIPAPEITPGRCVLVTLLSRIRKRMLWELAGSEKISPLPTCAVLDINGALRSKRRMIRE